MQITILGSGCCVPSLERSSACIKVISGKMTVVLDSGPGSLRQLLASGTTINDIDLVCYSHLHVDHTADFVPLLFASKYAPQARCRDLPILAAPGFQNFYRQLTLAYGDWIVPENFAVTWLECDQTVHVDSLILATAPMQHTPHSIAFRLHDSSGSSMVYSGDTGYCTEIVELARGCDVLILECSFPDEMRCEGHLTPELAGRIAAEAECAQLILTHFYPACEPQQARVNAAKIYAGTVKSAYDGMKIEC